MFWRGRIANAGIEVAEDEQNVYFSHRWIHSETEEHMRISTTLLTAVAVFGAAQAQAQTPAASTRAYRDGPVVDMTYVRTKPGMFDRYMQYLSTTYKTSMEAQKTAGLVTSYTVHASDPRTPQDHDVLLIVTYRNWAALDNFADRAEPVANRASRNTPAERDQAFADRSAMRDILGNRKYQVLLLK